MNFSTISIASSGLTAQRLRMDVISDNIANAETTRTVEGGPFKRSRVILKPLGGNTEQANFSIFPKALDKGLGNGVKVDSIEKDDAKPRLVYDPSHPDAIKSGPKEGYVEMPNVILVNEMVDLISAQRAYEANTTVVNGAKDIFLKSLEISKF